MDIINDEPILTRYIMNAIQTRGFSGSIVTGEKGLGKSVYAIKIAFYVYKTLYPNLDDISIYNMVLERTLFTIKDMISALKKATRKDEPIECLIWDDCLVHASSMHYFLQMKEVSELRSIFETIRTGCSSVIMTCTSSAGLLKFLREGDNLLIEIHKQGGAPTDRVARGYFVFRLPSGKRYFYKRYEDYFSCRLPNSIYEAYFTKRKQYLTDAIDSMDELIQDGDTSKKYSDIKKRLERRKIDETMEKLKRKGVEING